MFYLSTRDKSLRLSAAQAISRGLSTDGGLMMPAVLPKLSQNALETMKEMSYQQRAVYVMNTYLEEFTASELSAFAAKAYGLNIMPSIFHRDSLTLIRQKPSRIVCLSLLRRVLTSMPSHGAPRISVKHWLQSRSTSPVWMLIPIRKLLLPVAAPKP